MTDAAGAAGSARCAGRHSHRQREHPFETEALADEPNVAIDREIEIDR